MCSQLEHVWARGRIHPIIYCDDCSLVKNHRLDTGNVVAYNYLGSGDHVLQILISTFQTFIWFERRDTKAKGI